LSPPRRQPAGRERSRLRRAAASILSAGLEAAAPAAIVRRSLKISGGHLVAGGTRLRLGRGRLVLVAAGKAAASMARAAQDVLGGRLDGGLAIDSSPGPDLGRVTLLVARHPVPDARGLAAAVRVETLADGLEARDVLLVLLSGGASALLPAPAAGLSLRDKATATSALMRAGATIQELNVVRKHLSRLKGGGLARRAAPARVLCLALSDVVGDDLATIGSGPTVPDPSTYDDAIRIIARRGVRLPAAVRSHLEAGRRGERPETAKPREACFRRVTTRVIGSNRLSLEAAAREARRQGLRPLVLTTRLEGEAREVARVVVGVLRECVESGRPVRPPVCLLAGGETTVTVRGRGRGGRNQELVVAAIEPLAAFGRPAVVASIATDGIDGASDAAGGVADDTSAERTEALGLASPAAFLAASDSRNLLASLGDLILTGPTGTNVMDLVVGVAQ